MSNTAETPGALHEWPEPERLAEVLPRIRTLFPDDTRQNLYLHIFTEGVLVPFPQIETDPSRWLEHADEPVWEWHWEYEDDDWACRGGVWYGRVGSVFSPNDRCDVIIEERADMGDVSDLLFIKRLKIKVKVGKEPAPLGGDGWEPT